MRLVTVLGGYGVFGGRIATALAGHPDSRVRIVGRTTTTGNRFASQIGAEFSACDLSDLASLQRAIAGSFVVVHAAGPFQGSDYRVAEACIAVRSHYIDIADGRDFVGGIHALDEAARARGLFVTAGASTVPAITHAMISELRPQFHELDEIQIALSPGNQNPRGVATVAAILSYVGRPIRVWNQQRWELRTGWTDRDRVLFPSPLGNRRVYQCDAPDLELFPTAFGARSVQFRAGLELSLLNWALAGLSRLRSAGLLGNLPRYARLLARASKLLMPFGSRWGTLGVWVRGKDHTGNALQREIALVTDSDGPAIPIAPAVLLAKRLLDRGPPAIGAAPCLGFFSLKELGNFLRGHHAWLVHGTAGAWDKLPFGIGS